ncbi:MAG: hypothetical protein Tsb005_04900 [Gammaproteobacteria bacterium]
MEHSRAVLAEQVTRNLAEQNKLFPFCNDLIVFDNGSVYENALTYLPKNTRCVKASENIGYWGAIYWILHNYQHIFQRHFKYIYIIESDLLHYDMPRLISAEQLLDNEMQIGTVRTQKFSVKWRWLYDKRWSFLPFSQKHSVVAQYNAVTHEKIWYKKIAVQERLYLTNFHSKLPALNRVDAMIDVFNTLSAKKIITEMDYIELYYQHYQLTAVLDGGIYWSPASIPNTEIVSGSYSNEAQLTQANYKSSRVSDIVNSGFSVSLIKV